MCGESTFIPIPCVHKSSKRSALSVASWPQRRPKPVLRHHAHNAFNSRDHLGHGIGQSVRHTRFGCHTRQPPIEQDRHSMSVPRPNIRNENKENSPRKSDRNQSRDKIFETHHTYTLENGQITVCSGRRARCRTPAVKSSDKPIQNKCQVWGTIVMLMMADFGAIRIPDRR